jgi:hypothetical protein
MSARQRSHPGLDAYRGFAVVAMFVVHARRIGTQAPADESAAEQLLQLMMWAEPLIAASFLFIVGFSLVLSQAAQRNAAGWHRKILARAIRLYALSGLLFLPHYGLQWPDLVVSSGILSAIAAAIVLVGLCLGARRPLRNLAWLAPTVLGATALLERLDVSVAGLNAGPGGTLPLVGFTAAGAIVALLERQRGTQALTLAAAASALPTAAVLLSGQRWITVHASDYTVHGSKLALEALWNGSSSTTAQVLFWNHSALGAVGLLLPLGLSLLLFVGPQQALAHTWPMRPLQLLGRHALGAYVGHLLVLGLVQLGGMGPQSARGTWLLVGTLTAATCAGAAAWELIGPLMARRAAIVAATQQQAGAGAVPESNPAAH